MRLIRYNLQKNLLTNVLLCCVQDNCTGLIIDDNVCYTKQLFATLLALKQVNCYIRSVHNLRLLYENARD